MTAPNPKPAGWNCWLALAGGLVALKLWLVAAQPVTALGPAWHDDALFLGLAGSILDGQWLGSYSQFTLMKGPMYSLWVALLNLPGVPVPPAQHLLYLAGCLLVARTLPAPGIGPGARLAIFLLLWWNPMSFEQPVLGRVLRQNLYTPVTLLLFAGAFALTSRRHHSLRLRIAWGALLGLAFATLWLTREEGIWVVPSLLLLTGLAVHAAWRDGRSPGRLLPGLAAATLCGGGLLAAVCTLNARHYGWFGTVEFRAPDFLAAYGALQRVKSPYAIPYTPVTRGAREAIYAVSPAFARLQPHLEGPLGTAWAGACEGLTGRPRQEREIAGGWFMWALRDAVMAAYEPKNAREALGVYDRIADEVNQACADGRLPALSRRDTLAPRLGARDLPVFLRALPGYIDAFVTFRGFSAHPGLSSGSAESLEPFRRLMRWPLAPSPEAPELDDPARIQAERGRIVALHKIGKVLRWVGAAVAILGLLAWLDGGLRSLRRREWNPAWVAATAALGACAAVVLINALIHVFSFPNLSPGALAQAYPLLLLFGGISLADALAARTRPPASPDRREP